MSQTSEQFSGYHFNQINDTTHQINHPIENSSGNLSDVSMSIGVQKKQRKRKNRKANPICATGPTNKDQFQMLFAISERFNNQIAELQTKIETLEHENNNLKSIIALSNINPQYPNSSIHHQQLQQLYNDKMTRFTQCMQ